MKSQNLFIALTLAALLTGCAASLQPFSTDRARPGTLSEQYESLRNMPRPQTKVIAAVYRFRDQTGQYEASERGASWSTAVTQGATSILIRSLEESNWFTPIEREGLSNLLNERKIINNTRRQHRQQEQLPPLLFAGILLEGGIIGYDTNVLTGGAGIRLLGTSGSGQFRKDQVTIYLRAVSTQSGRVLKTVHTTKSIISQELKAGVFRYVGVNSLLEAETGFTYNEPTVMAVTEAIDQAVRQLVIEGTEEGIWAPADSAAFAAYKRNYRQFRNWQERAEIDYFGLQRNPHWRDGWQLAAGPLAASHIGNYSARRIEAGYGIEIEKFVHPGWSLELNGHRSTIGVENLISERYLAADLTLQRYLVPHHRWSPYVGVGGGVIRYDRRPDFTSTRYYQTANVKAGLDVRLSDHVGFQLDAHYRYLLRDGIDGVKIGSVHDQLWNLTAGLTINPKIVFKKIGNIFKKD